MSTYIKELCFQKLDCYTFQFEYKTSHKFGDV